MIVNGTPKTLQQVSEAYLASLGRPLVEAASAPLGVDLIAEPTGHLALSIVAFQRATARPVVIVAESQQHAASLADDLRFFLPQAGTLDPVIILPEIEQSPYRRTAPPRDDVVALLSGLTRLSQGIEVAFVVTTAAALLRRCAPASMISACCDLVSLGEELDREQFVRRLLDAGYRAESLVEDPGTFAVRGGLIDIFSPLYAHPLRIDLFGDEIESIRFFSPLDQRTIGEVEEAFVSPAAEVVLSERGIQRADRRLRELADTMEIPSREIRKLIEDLHHELLYFGIESLVPAFHDQLASPADYFPREALIIAAADDGVLSRLRTIWDERQAECQAARAENQLCYDVDALYLAPDEVIRCLESSRCWWLREFELADSPRPVLRPPARRHLGLRQLADGARDKERPLQPFVDQVQRWLKEKQLVILVSAYPSQQRRWLELLSAYDLPLTAHAEPPDLDTFGAAAFRPAQLHLVTGRLSRGFIDPSSGTVVVTFEGLFGEKVHRTSDRARKVSDTFGGFQELREGDHVVHVEHGIGKYHGLVTLTLAGVDYDFMRIDYKDADKLYVPVAQLNTVQKLAGGEANPVLAKLGGSTWAKAKLRVKESLRELAEELLQLYATREAQRGFAFTPPDNYFKEFEAHFPYEETPDQDRSIADVLADMCSPRPMDRLVCGDVGYGKTEVAMRAAFKAALDGKQVAVLAPTTVLVEQHLATFRDRFRRYPVQIDSLSRFKSKKEQQTVLAGLAAGKVDIVVATHRLLSSDVVFRDLGLLVVDEEQRFGVSHKEKIKQLRAQVDVLTLTATPIPRTLQMSITGIRDLSIIATPPRDRRSVITQVLQNNPNVVREGILRELKRGGQVFYVHNRVQGIMRIAQTLQELVPEARIVVAHGQMSEDELETRMLAFMKGEHNLMLCTTIIESGIDISRANTIFIHRADTFGLAQLYQLRGRVGRSKERAYCYLMVEKLDGLTKVARQRIGAMQRFSELGAGFQIATYDLEIRGAGELLGKAQSGQIATVGFEMYTQLMEEAIHEIKGEPLPAMIDPEVKLPLEALIPEGYVPDVNVRLILYKKLAQSRNESELAAVVDEIVDRFGPLPQPVENLCDVITLKIEACRLGIAVVELGGNGVAFTLTDQGALGAQQVLALVNGSPRLYRLTPEMVLIRKVSDNEAKTPVACVKKALHELQRAC